MELSRIILLYDDQFEVEPLTTVYGVVYMTPGLTKEFPWWIRRFCFDSYDYPNPDFFVVGRGVSEMIGIPLSEKAHTYRVSIFGQRWIEDVDAEIVSTFPPLREVSVQGDDYVPDSDLMKLLQNVG